MNLYPVYLLCYHWSAAAIGLDDGVRNHSFRPSALRSSKEGITHPQSCCTSKASLFFFHHSQQSRQQETLKCYEKHPLYL